MKMSLLGERLRPRPCKRPAYHDSDDEGNFELESPSPTRPKTEKKTIRLDVKENACQGCGDGHGYLLKCATCNYSYHPKCQLQPMRAPFPKYWGCPSCVSPLTNVEKILDCEMRRWCSWPEVLSEPVLAKQYLVKWRGLSYIHCTWVLEEEFVKASKTNFRLRAKLNSFHKKTSLNDRGGSEDGEQVVALRPEWTTVDRVIACRVQDGHKEFLVKWKELHYDECSWEHESDISKFQSEINKFYDIQSGFHRKFAAANHRDCKNEFQQYKQSPKFLSGGLLHPYQLEGLNFLRFSWSKGMHVILADEMGLGKTIQSIAFLASVLEEGHYPHLVIAPLSTLQNWVREFSKWAPHMNVVLYGGPAKAREIIQEHEFFYASSGVKLRAGRGVGQKRQQMIKFDVLLTTYEMINLDTRSLKGIKWQCMIVDEGHRLKNKESKLFSSLKQFSTRHRVLLTGTPLQNNLDELFMLMHFLDAGKFGSLEEFQKEYKDINREEQISRLHTMLGPHLLRRLKKDVMKELPLKKELMLQVDLSSKQKQYYRAILTRNYEQLTRQAKAKVSLANVVMELRKLCCHPFMIEAVEEPEMEYSDEYFRQLLETSEKMVLLDKLMVQLKERGHRVLIFSQFQGMLDLLENYLSYKKWSYERIDGLVSGDERQLRIDRFNAVNSSRFCFLLSTRAGGLGINLATADTIIIYDSDWNPHADIQAMARAHRLGQKKKVLICRLVTRGTVEEHIIEMSKNKMVLEHLVVGKLRDPKLNQEELDDILKYGSKELFADEEGAATLSRRIYYDDAAIHKILDRDSEDPEEKGAEEGTDSFLKAFKVAKFEEYDRTVEGSSSTQMATERASYWEELLKDWHEENKTEESPVLVNGKRSCRRQTVSIDAKDDSEASPMDDTSTGTTEIEQRAQPQSLPLMEGEGESLRVLGFTRKQRAQFLRILMRFGIGDYDWSKFIHRIKHKPNEAVFEYGKLFLTHIAEDLTDSPTFSDGVPKEFKVEDVLVQLGSLMILSDKVKWASENPGVPLFPEEIMSQYPKLLGGKFWTQEHDRLLLQAMLKHGYRRWKDMINDKELKFPQVIDQELSRLTATENTRHQVEFLKRRYQILEKALNAECAKQHSLS
ncbi:hypothetical protein SAY87_009616 [Trapa incisa]|uniref:CHD3-type chromatin-remodeling factor PICKLE n=1 Tax=Trapa incisa TaxID=236973 RepID=A0AAN7JYP2_9MYRT|nr:hypothetical protein SAY87_009616 [Trapa incisa]